MSLSVERLDTLATELVGIAKTVGGYLTAREVKFLAFLAACPTAEGDILEIGTFKGKSTVVLAKAGQVSGTSRVVTVDPFVLAGDGGPDAALAHVRANLERHGVTDVVECHQARATDLARTWCRKIRLLWIDGDHSYAAAESDFRLFAPFLSAGAMVAIHDVLNAFDGPIRVFAEDVLLSGDFGPAGLCGSIGWGQYCLDRGSDPVYQRHKTFLYCRLSRLIPLVAFTQNLQGLRKMRYKLLRWRVPHGGMNSSQFLTRVAAHSPSR